jgi:hypothetical protein
MKTIVMRSILVLVMFGFSADIFADGNSNVLLEAHFKELKQGTPVKDTNPNGLSNWDISDQCKGQLFDGNNNSMGLKIQGVPATEAGHDIYTEGYATTPALGFSGDIHLSFVHAKTNSETGVELSLTILNGGVFTYDNSTTKVLPVDVHLGSGRKSESLDIKNATPDTRIKFASIEKSKYFVIDDVIVTKKGICLEESSDNSAALPADNPIITTVNTVRTLTGGIWNTLCLPFDVTMATMAQALGTDQNIQLRTYSSYGDNVLTFANANETTITAGTPFLIKLNSTVVNPTFRDVTVTTASAQSVPQVGDVRFVGTYSPQTLLTDGTNLFLTTSNTLSVPAEETNTMRGLRAYFVVPSNFIPASARLAIDDETTGIETATIAQPRPAGTYDLNGRHVEHPRHGLYVVDGRLTFVK